MADPPPTLDLRVLGMDAAFVVLGSPGYLVRHPSRPWLFAVTESSPTEVTSLVLGPERTLTRRDVRRTAGIEGGCHLALTSDGRHLVVAGYGSGSVSSFAVSPTGSLSEQLDLFTFGGSGPDRDRQQAPHAHQVVSHGDEVLVCDLGTDRIHRLGLDDRGRFSTAAPPVTLPAGSGPRHLVVVEDRLVVACELSAELWLGRRTAQGWEEAARVPSTTRATGVRCYPSGVVAEGRRVFVGNRGVGTVAAFDLDAEQHTLSRVAEFPAGGQAPRDLALRRGQLWVANQPDDVVTVFATAALPPPGPLAEFPTPTPSCLVPLGGPTTAIA